MKPAKERILELDAVRGFALCGIHIVNVYQQVVFPKMFGNQPGLGTAVLPGVVRYGFYERFFPIFTLLFGISFAIFLTSAQTRTDHPRVVLARRLVALAAIGAVHQIFHHGEALLPYAVFGLILLLPATFARPRVTLILGLVLLVIGAQVVAGYGVMPGLLLTGYALGQLGLQNNLTTHVREWATAMTIFGLLAVAFWLSIAFGVTLPTLSFGVASLPSQLAGVATAMFYACALVLSFHTAPGRLVRRLLAPVGRMALTNYLMATAIFLLASPLLKINDVSDWPQVVLLVVAIIAIEMVISPLWLSRYRYGPIEWAWRCITWWKRQPMRVA